MTFEKFQKFIDDQDALFRSVKNASQTERERILSRTVKISEEFGELCDEVLASLGDQRKGEKGEQRGFAMLITGRKGLFRHKNLPKGGLAVGSQNDRIDPIMLRRGRGREFRGPNLDSEGFQSV